MEAQFCEYCRLNTTENKYNHIHRGNIILRFEWGSRRRWRMPDIILHYVADHKWLPPQEFINDVMSEKHEDFRTRTIDPAIEKAEKESEPVVIGFLEGIFATGDVPEGFVDYLENAIIHQKWQDDMDRQHRGIPLPLIVLL